MNPPPARHYWAADPATGIRPPAPEAHLEVRCHRRLRGPYTGAAPCCAGSCRNWPSASPTW
ncbi:hypothetical protein GXW82_00380 [Streptacidiphilus sp. 4-A2]|nr:hypothetical protein [Streptacidiphilus sp. 4-A2]